MRAFSGWGSSHLVESGVNVVGKLNLSDGRGASNGGTDAKSHNALLAKGSVEDSVLPCKQKIRCAESERESILDQASHFTPCVDSRPCAGSTLRVHRDMSHVLRCLQHSKRSTITRGCNG